MIQKQAQSVIAGYTKNWIIASTKKGNPAAPPFE
jgi:hypothetical protein